MLAYTVQFSSVQTIPLDRPLARWGCLSIYLSVCLSVCLSVSPQYVGVATVSCRLALLDGHLFITDRRVADASCAPLCLPSVDKLTAGRSTASHALAAQRWRFVVWPSVFVPRYFRRQRRTNNRAYMEHLHVTALQTRNKSNDYFESMQYRQDLFAITHYHKRKYFPSYTRCSENHNNTCSENRKIRGFTN